MQSTNDVAVPAANDNPPGFGNALRRLSDIAFGVVLPVVCLWIDPLVFRVGSSDLSMFGQFGVAMAGAILVAVVSMTAFLALPTPSGWIAGVFAGVLAGGSLLAVGVGVLLLPLSLATLATGAGFLGLVPFGTALVTGAASSRLAARCLQSGSAAKCLITETAGLLFFLASPCVLHIAVLHSTMLALSNDHNARIRGRAILAPLRFLINRNHLVRAFHYERDSDRAMRISELYAALGGGDVAMTEFALLRHR